MKILVTGGTGFIGGHLTKALVERGYEVSCLVRDERKAKPLKELGVELIEGEITDKKAVAKAVGGVELVYHLAAISGKSAVSASLYRQINIQGTQNIIEAALEARVGRFIYTSSVAVTGKLTKIPGDETSSYRPTDWYAKSKMAGEKLALKAAKRGLKTVVVRPGVIYGPGNINSSMAKFFRMVADGFCLLPGNGENLWDLTYIDDCIQGFILAGEKEVARGEIFIITGPQPVTINEIVKIIAQVSGVKLKLWHLPITPMVGVGKFFGLIENIFHLSMPFSDKTIRILSQNRPHTNEKAKKILGYKPSVPLEEGIAKTIGWYKNTGFIC